MAGPLLALSAPLSGVCLDLSTVPDPVFAQRMVGDGIAIDPTEPLLRAPCAGRVTQLHRARHALTLTHDSGVEVLMHVGLDTVSLGGEGFEPLVSEGDVVEAEQPLLRFEPDTLARRARSLICLIVLPQGHTVAAPKLGRVEGGAPLCEVHPAAKATPSATPKAIDALTWSEPIRVPNPSGLHARPAATLAAQAKALGGGVRIRRGRAEVSAESVVAVMGLDVRCGDAVQIGASDPKVVADLSLQVREGLGELAGLGGGAGEVLTSEPSLLLRPAHTGGDLMGVVASAGLAIGPAYRFNSQTFDLPNLESQGVEWELEKLERAITRSRESLQSLIADLKAKGSQTRAEILLAHETLLEDTALTAEAERRIREGQSAGVAWHDSTSEQADALGRSDNPLLAARAADLRDVRDRVLRRMFGRRAPIKAIPEGAILISEDIAPSILSALRPGQIVGIATTLGGATSHAAIIARGLGLPALCGMPESLLKTPNGETLILDAHRGALTVGPDAETLAALTDERDARDSARAAAFAAREGEAVTKDGVRIWVEANIGAVDDAAKAVEQAAEGVGLMRSEFLYLNHAHAPSEAEQESQYRAVAEALGPDRPLTIRTLDVGGDKPLPYLPLPHEENPVLGLRGVRVGLTRPALLRQQIRAILKGVGEGARIMFPMVGRLEELRKAKALVIEEAEALGVESVEVGVMIEVPSAALNASKLAAEADFFSIGTNDLSQYTLAIDRGHPQLAAWADGLDPAVLRLIQMTLEGAAIHGRRVGVCGGLASDPEAVPILIGLGVNHLSASLAGVAEIKALVRSLSRARCRQLATRALRAESAEDVRALIRAEGELP